MPLGTLFFVRTFRKFSGEGVKFSKRLLWEGGIFLYGMLFQLFRSFQDRGFINRNGLEKTKRQAR